VDRLDEKKQKCQAFVSFFEKRSQSEYDNVYLRADFFMVKKTK